EGNGAEVVTLALLDGHGDIDGFPQPRLEPPHVEARVSSVVDLGFGVVDQHLEVATVLDLGADAFGIFFEFGGVVGLGEEVLKEDGVRDADGLEVLHGRTQRAVIDVFIAPEADAPNLSLRCLLNDESDADGGGRNRSDFRADGGELTPVLGEQLFQGNFGLLDLSGIVLVLNRESDFTLLEPVEHVAGGNGIQSDVVDLADGRPLFEINVKDPTLGVLFALKADVLKVAGVPEGVKVAFDGGGIVDVADLAEDASLDRVGRDAAVAVDADANDEILLADRGYRQQQKCQPTQEAIPNRPTVPNSCGERRWRPVRVSLRARVVAESRGAHRGSMMTTMNRNYLEKLELGKR